MSDIYGYGGNPSYGGGANIGGILSALASLPASVVKALYAKPGLPDTFNQRYGSMQPPSVGPMGQANGPQVVGNAPQINTADIPQTQQPPIMDQPLTAQGGPTPSPIATSGQGGGAGPMAAPLPIGKGPLGLGGGIFGGLGSLFNSAADAGSPQNPLTGLARGTGAVLGGLGNMFQQMAMAGSPALQQQYFGRLIFQSMYNSLLQRGLPPDKALAIASSPQLQASYYGLPQHVGDVGLPGGTSIPLLSNESGLQLGIPGGAGGIGQISALGNQLAEANERAKATGQAQGQAGATLPTASNNFDSAIAGVDKVMQDPNLNSRLGIKSMAPPIPQTAAYDTQHNINELTGSLLPAAVQELQARGVGIRNPGLANEVSNAITDVRNAQGGTPGAFRESMTNLRKKLIELKSAAYEQAGQQAPAAPQAPLLTPLAGGTTQSGIKWSIVH